MIDEIYDINVPIQDIELLSDYIGDGLDEIKSSFDNVVNTYNKINEYWECKLWESAYSQLAQNAQTMENILADLKKHSELIEEIIDVYNSVESANKSMEDSLPYNVLR